MGSVYTKFSKGIKSSWGLSFSRSGRDNCDSGCKLFDGACYAERIERIYTNLGSKLAMHYKRGPLWVVNRAIAEFRAVDWGRLSVDGSLPARGKFKSAKQWRFFVKRLRVLVEMLLESGGKWHIPVESWNKAQAYRAALRGLGVVVRRTVQSADIDPVLRASDPIAWVVASQRSARKRGRITPPEIAENNQLARLAAMDIRSTGKTAVICPAIVSDSKCGQCTACSDSSVDVILYPLHN